MMEVGVLHIPTTPLRVAEMARRAEKAGAGWFGVADSPRIFGALYPSIQHALAATSTIRIGPLVTNPVTRHWSVHAANFQAFEELYPGRTFLGISAGDSAVRSVGLLPGSPGDVAQAVEAVRAAVGPELPIITAVGGRKAAASVSPDSDGVLLGTGLDAAAIADLAAAAEAPPGGARTRWVYAVCNLTADPGDNSAAREAIRAPVVSFSRHALSGRMGRRHVPAELVAGLEELYAGYDVGEHSRLDSANARLLANRTTEETYLMGRFALVDTPPAAAARVEALAAQVGEFGIFLSTAVPDPVRHLSLIERFIDCVRDASPALKAPAD